MVSWSNSVKYAVENVSWDHSWPGKFLMPAPASCIHCKEGQRQEFCFWPSGYTPSSGPVEKYTLLTLNSVMGVFSTLFLPWPCPMAPFYIQIGTLYIFVFSNFLKDAICVCVSVCVCVFLFFSSLVWSDFLEERRK